jgi:LemA protein
MDSEAVLSNTISSIIETAESYPQLASSVQFLHLQQTLLEIENRLQAVRRAYNASVKELHNFQELIPTNIIAKCITIKKYPYYL